MEVSRAGRVIPAQEKCWVHETQSIHLAGGILKIRSPPSPRTNIGEKEVEKSNIKVALR